MKRIKLSIAAAVLPLALPFCSISASAATPDAPATAPGFFETPAGIVLLVLLILLLLGAAAFLFLFLRRRGGGGAATIVINTGEPTPAGEPAGKPTEKPDSETVEEADREAIAAAVAEAMAEVREEIAAAPAEVPAAVEPGEIEFIDTQEDPEAYAQMLAREAAGEGQIVYRYKRSFLARLALSEGAVQDHYNGIKNALLSYKGVKSRMSTGYDAFNTGRTKIAKIIPKDKTLLVYLALDPAAVLDTKYNVEDVSGMKKFEATPLLIKVRGERKYRHAIELIDRLCGEVLACRKLDREPEDFRIPGATTESLLEAGLIRRFAGLAPLSYTASYVDPDGGSDDEDPDDPENA